MKVKLIQAKRMRQPVFDVANRKDLKEQMTKRNFTGWMGIVYRNQVMGRLYFSGKFQAYWIVPPEVDEGEGRDWIQKEYGLSVDDLNVLDKFFRRNVYSYKPASIADHSWPYLEIETLE